MKSLSTLQGQPIAALATPPGRSALAVIRTSGDNSIFLVSQLFSRPKALLKAAGNSVVYGWIQETFGDGKVDPIDEVNLGVFRAPRSYTGEEGVELYCHGSMPGVRRILALLFANGFRQAEPGEFTLRAFLNGKMDLTRAEAVHQLIQSTNRSAQSMSLQGLSGRVFQHIDEVKSSLVDMMAAVAVQLDYPDEELPDGQGDGELVARLIDADLLAKAKDGLNRLVASYRAGRIYSQGIPVALAGRTNAGKSSLFNLFLKEDRSIVSQTAGTTRDYIEAHLDVDGLPVLLYDTAGLREVEEIVEAEGIRRSGQIIEHSQLILYLVDASDPSAEGRAFDEQQLEHMRSLDAKVIQLWTKVDANSESTVPQGFIGLSVKTGQGFEELLQEIHRFAGERGSSVEEFDVVIQSIRQQELIRRTCDAIERVVESLDSGMPLDIIAMDLQDGIAALGEITGEVSSDDVLDRVFSGFCVGK